MSLYNKCAEAESISILYYVLIESRRLDSVMETTGNSKLERERERERERRERGEREKEEARERERGERDLYYCN